MPNEFLGMEDHADSPNVAKNTSFSFSWENLSLWVTEKRGNFWSTKRTKRYILENECGRVQSNGLVAIMGPSGVGKTTFLAALAGKNEDMTGTFYFNQNIIPRKHIKNISGYVYQDDLALDTLTVEEHITFMNSLKSSNNETNLSKVLEELNLEACRNSQIKNLSGGEKKRLSLAVELLNDPLILFCDEPTTGLDSYSAITIIQKLQSRTQQGKLVILTIHQPSSHIFEFFDHLVLMSNGRVFFQGDKCQVSRHFESLGLICPLNYNAADFYINCMSKSCEFKRFPSVRNQLFVEEVGCKYSISSKFEKGGFCKELYWLIWRETIDTRKKFGYHAFQFGLLMVTASLLAFFYSFVDTTSDSAVQNIRGIMFFFTSELIFTHTYNVINTFPEEYHIILREKELYSNASYFLAKVLSILPRNIIQPLAFISINFIFIDFLCGFDMFCQMFGVLFAACLSGSILGLCISAVFSSLEYMDLFIAPFELITMLAAGILIKLDTVVYFGWVKYLSPFFYTYESLSVIYWSRIEKIGNRTGIDVLEEIGFITEPVDIFWNILYMTLLSVVIAVIAFLTISYKRKVYSSY